MFKAIFDVMLGPWGRAILDFYFTNQTIINAVFLIWAGIITYASVQMNNIRRMTIHLGSDFLENSHHLTNEAIWEAFQPKWQEEIAKINPRFIPNRLNLWITNATPENIIHTMQLGPDWFAALRKGEVLRYRFARLGENYKLSMFLKSKPQK